jgi:hypothetical protein
VLTGLSILILGAVARPAVHMVTTWVNWVMGTKLPLWLQPF